jgi:hypothetical protein
VAETALGVEVICGIILDAGDGDKVRTGVGVRDTPAIGVDAGGGGRYSDDGELPPHPLTKKAKTICIAIILIIRFDNFIIYLHIYRSEP